ncbi:MAG: UvrB/UvrC motif-containing protein [Planctomycetota bacterium]
MDRSQQHLDDLLNDWPYEFGEVAARHATGGDGRELLQLRIDMGVLQMEVEHRPDGNRPGGFDTFYDQLISLAFDEGEAFELDEERCMEVDREFVQFYHRRIGWLALRDFSRAVRDADHTLRLMDFTSAHAPNEEWADLHEQYRAFVLFHRTQADALAKLDEQKPEAAVQAIDAGIAKVREVFELHDMLEDFEEDDLVKKLVEMKEALSELYELRPSLAEQLAEAIADEQYERAAEIRDRMARRPGGKL